MLYQKKFTFSSCDNKVRHLVFEHEGLGPFAPPEWSALLDVGVFLAGGKRAGETAAAIANGKSAIAAAYGNVGDPIMSNCHRTCGSSPELSSRQSEK